MIDQRIQGSVIGGEQQLKQVEFGNVPAGISYLHDLLYVFREHIEKPKRHLEVIYRVPGIADHPDQYVADGDSGIAPLNHQLQQRNEPVKLIGGCGFVKHSGEVVYREFMVAGELHGWVCGSMVGGLLFVVLPVRTPEFIHRVFLFVLFEFVDECGLEVNLYGPDNCFQSFFNQFQSF